MERNVIIAVFVLNMLWLADGAPPFSVTIDCEQPGNKPAVLGSRLSPPSLCDCIQKAFPRGVQNGRFLLRDSDQDPAGDTQCPVSVRPPADFLRAAEPASAERLERFQKGVQKMMHVVNVLGQVDKYLSDRTRILVNKLSKVYEE